MNSHELNDFSSQNHSNNSPSSPPVNPSSAPQGSFTLKNAQPGRNFLNKVNNQGEVYVDHTLEQGQHWKMVWYEQLYFDRYSFGFGKLRLYPSLVKWRLSDVVLCSFLCVAFLFNWFYQVEPFQRQFFVNDLTISHPFAEHERVSGGALLFVSFILTTLIVIGVSILLTPPRNKVYVTFVSLLGLYIGLFTNCLVTEILKVWIGRHRPDFLARCVVSEDAPLNTMVFAKDVCTTKHKHILLDGFKTTPSGHSSISFAGLGYTALWLSGQLLVGHIDTGSWRTIVSGIPLMGAGYIAISRTEDYRHHFVDVILGSLLGSLIAWWSYRRIFPSITDEYCFLPYQLIEDEKEKEGPDSTAPYSLSSLGQYQPAPEREII